MLPLSLSAIMFLLLTAFAPAITARAHPQCRGRSHLTTATFAQVQLRDEDRRYVIQPSLQVTAFTSSTRSIMSVLSF